MNTKRKRVWLRLKLWWNWKINPVLDEWGLHLIAASAALWCFVLAGRAHDFSVGDWASWVQAVGSVIAILVAVHVSSEQFRQAEKHRRKQEMELAQRQFDTTIALVNALKTCCTFYRELIEEGNLTEQAVPDAIATVRDRLRPLLQAPVWEFAKTDLAGKFIDFASICELFLAEAREASDRTDVFGHIEEQATLFLAAIEGD